MNIALDATYSLGDELSGVGIYSRELLFGLAHAHPEAGFRFCYRPHRYLRSWRETLPPNVRRGLLAEPLGPRSADIFHALNQRVPRLPLKRCVVTFHDLFVLSSEYSTPEFRARFAAQAKEAAARADAIITVSQFTKSQVTELLDVDASKVHVVHHGVRALPAPSAHREKIVLSVGAIQKRKNTARLVEAFESVDAGWRLVLAGSAGFGFREIMSRIESSSARDRITVTGYLSGTELAGWYSRASVFAFPSLDEGFGMPVLEAMASGIPVLTSNRSALPEVAGDAAVLIDPEDTAALRAALCRLTQEDNWRAALAARGQARAELFTWDRAVRETWQVYQELAPPYLSSSTAIFKARRKRWS
ncbi:MAG TPA: glycosyltransferase family 1 protein [Bryobacteraceae bacterium]|nr:glycosyltransferase family 1 protein [Bryobacteraceae bacterium]